MIFGGIGLGNMGGAIIDALDKACSELISEKSEILDGYALIGYDHHQENLDKLKNSCGMNACEDELMVAEHADIIIIGVKPYGVVEVLNKISKVLTKDKIVISLAAGISLECIQKVTKNICPCVLLMPNTPIMIGEGCSAICFDDPALSEGQKNMLHAIFSKVGLLSILKEQQFPEFSALMGSGPAFIFYMQEAMVEAAIRLGFKHAESRLLVDKLFIGSAKLAESQTQTSHASLRLNVCSPKGSTINGINALDKAAVKSGIIEGVLATYSRAFEMSKGK